MSSGMGSMSRTKRWLFHRIDQTAWEVRRGAMGFTRLFGAWGWAISACAALAAVAGLTLQHDMADLVGLKSRLAAKASSRAPDSVNVTDRKVPANSSGREKLKSFETNLLPHADIPVVVQNLLRLAEDDGLLIRRGDYRLQTDAGGGFVRYQMTLPVKGTAAAIHHFIESALVGNSALALESVQFRRDRIESAEIEARLQWVLLAEMQASKPITAVRTMLRAEVSP